MILSKSAADAATDRQLYQGRDGHSAWVTSYFGTETLADPSLPRPADQALFPVAFMVEEAPQATLGAHFHRADQFQLFVRGNGRLGNAAIQPLTVHLASAFTAYGPIHAGDQGLAYLTLRNGFDPGPRYLPQAAAELRRDRSQSPHQKLIAIPEIDAAVTEASIAVLDNGPDGWGIWQRRHPPHHRVLGEDIGDGGQYWVIRRGSAVIDGVAMGPLSCLFLAKGARPPALVTTGAGVDIVVLQFAPHALNWPQAGRDHETTHNTT